MAQARADLGTAVANQKLAAITAKRWNDLAKENAVAPQDVDTKNANLAAMTAAVASAKANVDRLVALEGFKSIVAPFDGTVTSRAVDVGDLVTVPTTTTAGSGAALHGRRRQQSPHLCERAAELLRADQAGDEGELHRTAASRPGVRRDARRERRVGEYADRNDPDPSFRPTMPATCSIRAIMPR